MDSFLEAQMLVQQIMLAGRPFEDAEDVANDPSYDFTDDERAALWLYAWSLLHKDKQQTMALRYLESLDSVTWHPSD